MGSSDDCAARYCLRGVPGYLRDTADPHRPRADCWRPDRRTQRVIDTGDADRVALCRIRRPGHLSRRGDLARVVQLPGHHCLVALSGAGAVVRTIIVAVLLGT